MVAGFKMKKCPRCNSTKLIEWPRGFRCLKCGFINDKDYLKKNEKRI
jgi:ribosomal protein S27AE